MTYCSNCGRQNPDGVEICVECTAALGAVCPACAQCVPQGSRFCNRCGESLPQGEGSGAKPSGEARIERSMRALMPSALAQKIGTAASEIAGERREVTVLFLDVANFTATAHALDSEDVYLFTNEAMCLLAEVVYRYEGNQNTHLFADVILP